MLSKTQIYQNLKSFFRCEEATTAVEYALLLALIAIFCMSAVLSAGDVQKSLWFDTSLAIESHIVP